MKSIGAFQTQAISNLGINDSMESCTNEKQDEGPLMTSVNQFPKSSEFSIDRSPLRCIPEFRHSEIQIGEKVGRGQYGMVSELVEIRIVEKEKSVKVSTTQAKPWTESTDWRSRMYSTHSDDEVSDLDGGSVSDGDENCNTDSTLSFEEDCSMMHESVKSILAQSVTCGRGSGRFRYAVKRLRPNLQTSRKAANASADMAKEANYLASLSHPNIVRLRATVGTPGSPGFMLVMDRLYDTLKGRIDEWSRAVNRQKSPFSPFFCMGGRLLKEELATRLEIAYDIGRALRYLHSKRILHRDIKPDNAAFSVLDEVRLFDFGLATELRLEMLEDDDDAYRCTAMAGSPRWMAPEVYLGKFYGFSADVHSFGLMLWNLCSLKTPYGPTLSLEELESKVIRKGWRPKRLTFVSDDLNSLMSECWSSEPSERPKFDRICSVLQEACITLQEEERSVDGILNHTKDMMDDSTHSVMEASQGSDSDESFFP